MKKRSPIAVYLFLLFTSFIYLAYWVYQLIDDLNVSGRQAVFDKKKIFALTSVFILPSYIFVYGILIFPKLLPYETLVYIALTIAVLFFAGIIMFCLLLKKVVEIIAGIEKQMGIKAIINYWMVLFLLPFCMLCIPYIQVHINKIMESESYAK